MGSAIQTVGNVVCNIGARRREERFKGLQESARLHYGEQAGGLLLNLQQRLAAVARELRTGMTQPSAIAREEVLEGGLDSLRQGIAEALEALHTVAPWQAEGR